MLKSPHLDWLDKHLIKDLIKSMDAGLLPQYNSSYSYLMKGRLRIFH